nr:TlpA disulfide reductase family protein [Mucilaginibacter sp. L294]
MKTTRALFFVVFSLIALNSFSQSTFIPEGKWRGVFHNANGTDVPFNFEVKGKTAETAKVYLLNAQERFETGTLTQKGDSLYIPFEQFDTELAFKIGDKKLTGSFRRKEGGGRTTPVDATYGQTYRFEDGEKPTADISGNYDVTFKSAAGKEEKTVGLFKQKGNKLYATFMRISGDSRFLEGTVQGNKFFLSSFIGGGIAYYTGSFNAEGVITGSNASSQFTGIKDAAAALPDPYTLTYLKPGYTSFDLSLPDVDGKQVSLKDEKYKNKVVIVTITGTWCPNCIDEANFLAPWYKKNKSRGVEAIGVHFERKADAAYVKTAIEKFKKRYGIEYDEVFGGLADKNAVAASFPALNNFLSFPTILFIDKKGNVAKIYTGFTGPATGVHYDQFIKEFNAEIDTLLKKQI